MGVMLQAFYWDCPQTENREHQWWSFIKSKLPAIAQAGFTALWLPPANKAASWKSMGYDPYDYYDLGEFDQKGGVPTWFGSKADLLDLIESAHALGSPMSCSITTAARTRRNQIQSTDSYVGQNSHRRATSFRVIGNVFIPVNTRRGTAARSATCRISVIAPRSFNTELINYARWLLEEIGFDGFRYDMVKGYGGWMVRSIQELRALRDGTSFKPYAVGECWDSERTIDDWLDEANAWSDNPVGAFDFPLRWRLRDLCDSYGFSLRTLVERGVLMWGRPEQAVTFVENHDVVRDTPIINDKLLAYAFILTHEGYPCVFWQDYFNWNLAQPDNQSGIDALVKVHEQNAASSTQILFTNDDLYIMQRSGTGDQSGLVFVLNNRGTWNGTWVQTRWNNTRLVPAAWHGRDDVSVPESKWTNESRWLDLWAPPRGYVVYVPE